MLRKLALTLALLFSLSASAGELTYEPGTSGLSVAKFNLFTGANLSSLASGSCATSTATALTQTSTNFSANSPGGATSGWLEFVPAGAFTPTAGGYAAVWLIRSADATNYETALATCSTTQGPFNRAPDFVIPFAAVAVASGNIIDSGYGQIPPGSFKAVLWNNTGTAFSANNHVVNMAAFMQVQH